MIPSDNQSAAAELLADIRSDVESWDWEADEDGPDLRRYAGRIEEIGRTRVLRSVYLCCPGSAGTDLLLHLSTQWEHLPFDEWLEVLTEAPPIDDGEIRHYHAFFSSYLGIDLVRAVEGSALFSSAFKDMVRTSRARGYQGVLWGHVENVFENLGINCFALWRRLADEGAPMLLSEEELTGGPPA